MKYSKSLTILLTFLIFLLFICNSSVFAASITDFDVPSGFPSPSAVYNSLPDNLKKIYSPDLYCLCAIDDATSREYNYYFLQEGTKFRDTEGWCQCSAKSYLRVSFPRYDFSSVPTDFTNFTTFESDYNDTYGSVYDRFKCKYLFSTFNVYADRSYSDDKILFLQTSPLTLSMGEILLQNKDKVLHQVVLLLPIVLVALVSLIGLRKALQMLMNFLRKS